MPTYLDQYRNVQNNDSGSSQELNCRQVYEHVQGCPLCKTALRQENGHQFTTSPSMVSDIPQSVIFLVVALIIIMVMYIVKNLSI